MTTMTSAMSTRRQVNADTADTANNANNTFDDLNTNALPRSSLHSMMMDDRSPIKPSISFATTAVAGNVRPQKQHLHPFAIQRSSHNELKDATKAFVTKISMSRSRTDTSNRTEATEPLSLCSTESQDSSTTAMCVPSHSVAHAGVHASVHTNVHPEAQGEDREEVESHSGYMSIDEAKAEAAAAAFYSGSAWKQNAWIDDDDAQSIIAAAIDGNAKASSPRRRQSTSDDAMRTSSSPDQSLLSRMLFSCGTAPVGVETDDASTIYQDGMHSITMGLEQMKGISTSWLKAPAELAASRSARQQRRRSTGTAAGGNGKTKSASKLSPYSLTRQQQQLHRRSSHGRFHLPSSPSSVMSTTIHENDSHEDTHAISCDEQTAKNSADIKRIVALRRQSKSPICKEDGYTFKEFALDKDDLSTSSTRLRRQLRHKNRRMLV